MEAKKCDRCGQYFTTDDFILNAMDGKTYYSLRSFKVNTKPDKIIWPRYEIDLCPECAEKLREFMEEVKG